MTQDHPTDNELINALADQFEHGELYTPPSTRIGHFDLARAYELQRAYVANWQTRDTVGGFKAAVTAPPMQKAFGLAGPVTSVLFARGERNNGDTISLSVYRTLLIETELSYQLRDTISTPLTSLDEVRGLVARCAPAFELADPGFGAVKFTGEDLVASNIACNGWLAGDAIDCQDLDAIQVTLQRDGEVLHDASAGSVMDGQWPALMWLINQTVAQGYTITPDHILLTGAIGGAHPGQPGDYTADYSDVGRISFRLTD